MDRHSYTFADILVPYTSQLQVIISFGLWHSALHLSLPASLSLLPPSFSPLPSSPPSPTLPLPQYIASNDDGVRRARRSGRRLPRDDSRRIQRDSRAAWTIHGRRLTDSVSGIAASGGGRYFRVGEGQTNLRGPPNRRGPHWEPRGPRRLMKGPWLTTASECATGPIEP